MACALDATVSIVSGPELKSKWVGESLPYDEELFVTINGEARRIEIGNLVENYSDQEVGCWTYEEDGTGCFRPVTAFLEHEGPDYVDVLITETGREVRVTGGHSVFVNREGLLTEVLAEEVVPEETRIAVPLRIKSPQTTTEINLFRLFNGRRDIHVSGYEELLQEALKRKEDLTIAFDRCTPNTAPVARLANWKRKPQVSLGALQDCLEQAGMGRFEHDVKMHCWQRGKEFPSRIPLTEDFGEFLGIWIAKGDYNKNCVRITVNERQVTHYQTLCEKLFGHVTKYEDDRDATLILSSALLQRLMEKGLSMHTGAHYKRVPSIVWTAPEPFIQAFLRGYFSGDGTFNKKTIEATTVSRGLADDIMCLLQYVGIAARCKTRQEWNGTTSYRVRFTWSAFLRTFVEKIGFCEENRNEDVLNYVDNLKLKRALQTPEQHISNDILWDKIVERRRIPYDGQHVYDISVQGTERFLAGFGNVLVHNSEGNLREVFSKARKSAPSIIVFDEIDSFATTRGTYSGSGVEHSMVNQLLTEMDGFRKEELVFVVGTTNFPESLDPALLRPGRFEMQIEIPYPDDKDREAILQIYRDKFKLDLSKELLDFLVQKTSGFSDAKSGVRFSGDHLYAICRSLKREAIRRSWKGNKKSEITKEDCIKSLSKKDGKKFDLQEKEERAIAIHEAGHAIIAHFCPNSSGIERISVATDSEDILGFVLRSQGENKYVRTKGELLDDICICMGGRVAEALFLDDVSIGCANDLQKATEVARIMVEELGMSDEVGLQVYTSSMGHAHTRGERRQMSASAAEKLDSEIGKILTLQHERAQEIIEQYKGKLEELVGALVEKKTLYKKEIEELLKIEKTVDPKSKKKGKTKK